MSYLVDPTQDEAAKASAIICLAMTPNQKEVTLWSQSGRLDSLQANQAMELCRNGCRTMHKFMRELWLSQSPPEQSSATTVAAGNANTSMKES